MDLSLLQERIIAAYADGSPVEVIAESFNLTHELVLKELHDFRDQRRNKRAFSNAFKKMIAERDLSGEARSAIAKDLGVNINTVKKSCEEFGQTLKERATSDNFYTRIEGEFPTTECVSCKSKDYNLVEDNTYYCFKCGKEHIHNDDHVLQVNWEYLD